MRCGRKTGSRHEGAMANSFKAPALLAALLVTASALPAHARVQPATNTKPMAVPIVRQVPDPEDKPFPAPSGSTSTPPT
jgi:hypothetical protein